jgi:hypothetical protein
MQLPPDPDVGNHIPGSGIDFASIGRLWLVGPGDIAPGAPVAAKRTIRRNDRERLVNLPNMGYAVGDLIVAASGQGPAQRIGRPVQIHFVDEVVAVGLDDPTLGRPRSPGALDGVLRSSPTNPPVVWHLLDLWGVYRCLKCGAPGRPPNDGCALWPEGGDVACSRCDNRWDSPPHSEVIWAPTASVVQVRHRG